MKLFVKIFLLSVLVVFFIISSVVLYHMLNLDTKDCNGKEGLLSYSPVAVSDISTIVPLGNLAPPGHNIPTVHMYYNYKQVPGAGNFPVKTTLFVPADMTITQISLEDNNSSIHPFNSYKIEFTICKQLQGYFYHVVTLNDKLAKVMQPPYDSVTTSNVGAANPDHNYTKNVNVKLLGGEVLGTGGGALDLPDGLDFALIDTRFSGSVANPVRWNDYDRHYVCSLDYYPATLSSELYSYIGEFGLQKVDPGTPKCGEVYQDIPGTLQGVWFAADLPKDTFWDANGQLSFIHSNYDHSLGVIAMGNDAKKMGITPSAYGFHPEKEGNINLDFSLTSPGNTYCYEGEGNNTDTKAFVVQMISSTEIFIGILSTSHCGKGPWILNNSLEYIR